LGTAQGGGFNLATGREKKASKRGFCALGGGEKEGPGSRGQEKTTQVEMEKKPEKMQAGIGSERMVGEEPRLQRRKTQHVRRGTPHDPEEEARKVLGHRVKEDEGLFSRGGGEPRLKEKCARLDTPQTREKGVSRKREKGVSTSYQIGKKRKSHSSERTCEKEALRNQKKKLSRRAFEPEKECRTPGDHPRRTRKMAGTCPAKLVGEDLSRSEIRNRICV